MFAKNLKELRKKNNLSQKDVANAIGVLEATVSMWETGKRVPYHDLLVKIANFFDVSVDYLLGNERNISKNEQQLKEKEILKKILKDIGFMKDNEDLTDDELKNLIKFVKNNKDFIKGIK